MKFFRRTKSKAVKSEKKLFGKTGSTGITHNYRSPFGPVNRVDSLLSPGSPYSTHATPELRRLFKSSTWDTQSLSSPDLHEKEGVDRYTSVYQSPPTKQNKSPGLRICFRDKENILVNPLHRIPSSRKPRKIPKVNKVQALKESAPRVCIKVHGRKDKKESTYPKKKIRFAPSPLSEDSKNSSTAPTQYVYTFDSSETGEDDESITFVTTNTGLNLGRECQELRTINQAICTSLVPDTCHGTMNDQNETQLLRSVRERYETIQGENRKKIDDFVISAGKLEGKVHEECRQLGKDIDARCEMLGRKSYELMPSKIADYAKTEGYHSFIAKNEKQIENNEKIKKETVEPTKLNEGEALRRVSGFRLSKRVSENRNETHPDDSDGATKASSQTKKRSNFKSFFKR